MFSPLSFLQWLWIVLSFFTSLNSTQETHERTCTHAHLHSENSSTSSGKTLLSSQIYWGPSDEFSLHSTPCQAPGVIGSALFTVRPGVSILSDWADDGKLDLQLMISVVAARKIAWADCRPWDTAGILAGTLSNQQPAASPTPSLMQVDNTFAGQGI